MDLALRRLHSCHLVGNCNQGADRSSHASRTQVQVQATAAANPPPITLSQRALLQTAARRTRGAQPQQQQPQQPQGPAHDAAAAHQIQQRLSPELRNSMFRAHQLELEEFQELMAEHERRQQQRMRQQKQPKQQQQQPSQALAAGVGELDHHQQQQQQLQEQEQQQPPLQADGHAEAANQLAQRRLLQQQLALHQLLKQQQQRKRQLQLQLRREPAVLTTLIKHSTSWQRLQQLFSNLTPLFNPIHVSATITHLAQLQPDALTPARLAGMPPGFQQLVQELTAAAVACIPDFGPRQIANSLWAISRLGASDLVTRKLRADFLAAFADRLQYAAPQHVAVMAASVANMGWTTSSEWRHALLEAATLRLPYFNPPELAILLHAVARLEAAQPSAQWVAGVLDACSNHMPAFSLQELSMLAVSLARLQHRPQQDWLVAFVRATQLQLAAAGSAGAGSAAGAGPDSQGGIKAQGVVNVLWALAKWGVVPPGSWHACCLAAVEQLSDSLTLQGISTLLWSFAKLQLQVPSRLLLQLLARCQPLLPQAKASDLAMLAWALGTMGVTAATLSAQAAAPYAAAAAAEATPVGVSAAAPMFVGVQAGVAHPLRSGGAGFMHLASPAAADAHGSDSSSTQAASSRSRSRHGRSWGAQWLRDFLYHSYRVLPAATAADVASLLVGAVRMQLSPGDQWLSAVQVEAAHRLAGMLPVQLTSTLLCLACLRAKPSQSFLDAYCSCSEALLAATAAAARSKHRRLIRVRQTTTAGSSSSSSATRSARAQFAAAAATAADVQCYAPQSLSNTLGALAMLGCRPPAAWCEHFFAASAALLPRFSGRDFAYMIWALALLELQPPQAWMDAFLVQLRSHVPRMTSQQLSAVIWALARLKHRPGVDWMERFLDRVAALTPQAASASAGGSGGAGDAADGSGGVGGTPHHAPPSPVQLSGYFGSIILQGLTAWAASCLDLGFDGSSSSSSSSGSSVPATTTTRRRTRRWSATTTEGKGRGAAAAGGVDVAAAVADSQDVAVVQVSDSDGAATSPTVASDGSILFKF